LDLRVGSKTMLFHFTLGVKDSRAESPNTMLANVGLKRNYHENVMLS
jgi:hypothetical protein